jgi:hypothetical protein
MRIDTRIKFDFFLHTGVIAKAGGFKGRFSSTGRDSNSFHFYAKQYPETIAASGKGFTRFHHLRLQSERYFDNHSNHRENR